MYSAWVGADGGYSLTVTPGQYKVCTHGAGVYLDSCQQGTPWTGNVSAAVTVAPAIRLIKGGRFLVRVHDINNASPSLEKVVGPTLFASVARPSGAPFVLPLVYNGRVRDYGPSFR